MPAKVAARESAGCWMTGMALLLLTKSACQLLLRPPRRVPASAFRPSAKHAAGKLPRQKGACTGRRGLFIAGLGESPRPLPPRLAKWAQRFNEMTEKRRGQHEIRALPGDKLHGMELRFARRCSRRVVDAPMHPCKKGPFRTPTWERWRMSGKLAEASPVVFVVDDDVSIRESLSDLLLSIGLRVETFASAAEFLQIKLPDAAGCLVLDVRLPGLSGLDFQAELASAGIRIPIVFMTGHGDIPMTVRAMKAGAVEFLTKPFREQDMLDAIQAALEKDRARREQDSKVSDLRNLFDSLTNREQEVIGLVTAGLMNKQIAAEIGVSEITVKVHRSNVMRKMRAKSLADLVRMADALGIRRQRT